MPEFVGTLKTPRLTSAPSSPVKGQMYFDTTTNILYWYNGTIWVTASGSTNIYEQATQPTEPVAVGSLWIDSDDPPVLGPTGPAGPTGPQGPTGAAGQGVPVGGTQGQALVKKTATDYDTQWGAAGADLVYDGDFASGPTYKDGEIVVWQDSAGRKTAFICTQQTTAAPIAWPGGPPVVPPYPTPNYGTTLPATPVDGQEAILVDSITAPTYQWRFRYNAGSTSAQKWEYVGGIPKFFRDDVGSARTGPTSWVDMAYSITVPRAGIYNLEFGCRLHSTGTPPNYQQVSPKCPGTTAPNYYIQNSMAAAYGGAVSGATTLTIVTAGDAIGFAIWNNLGDAYWIMFWARVTPVRVS